MNNNKIKILILCSVPLLLAGCGNSNVGNAMQTMQKQNEKAQETFGGTNKKNTEQIYLDQGKNIISGKYISVPFILENTNNSSAIQLDSSKFELIIQKKYKKEKKGFMKTTVETHTEEEKIYPYSPYEKNTNYLINLDSQNQLQSFITFKLSNKQLKKYSKKELENAKLKYKSSDGKTYDSHDIPNSITDKQFKSNLSDFTTTDLIEYYENIGSTLSSVRQQESILSTENKQAEGQNQNKSSSTSSINSLNESEQENSLMSSTFSEQYNDTNYGELKFNIKRMDSTHVLFIITNNTEEPMSFCLDDFQLEGRYNHSVTISPNYMRYSIFIPIKRTVFLIVPLSDKINEQKYTPQIKIQENGNPRFISINDLPNAIKYGDDNINE